MQHKLIDGSYNRQSFLKALIRLVDKATSGKGESIMLYIAVDKYEAMKERIGSSSVGRIIADIASIIQSVLKENDHFARFGNDSFAVLIESGDLDFAQAISERVRRKIEQKVWSERGITVIDTCSICVYLITRNTSNPYEALQQAASVCRLAQDEGGNRVSIHPGSLVKYTEAEQSAREIRNALVKDRFHLFFQPIAYLHGDPKPMYEVLLRLIDENDVILFPKQFFLSSLNSKLKNTLDRWVIDHVIHEIKKIHGEMDEVCFFIKLSNSIFDDDSLLDWLTYQTQTHQVPTNMMVLEINEIAAMENLDKAKTFLGGLKSLGCKTILTQFGTEINPAATLNHLPTDYVKLNGDLVLSLPDNPEHQKNIQLLTKIAHDYDKLVITDHVENARTLALLWQFGVDYASGYYIQVPANTLEFDFTFDLSGSNEDLDKTI